MTADAEHVAASVQARDSRSMLSFHRRLLSTRTHPPVGAAVDLSTLVLEPGSSRP